ncbi:MAG: hypothetical protein PF448_06360 [Bacteroidales bacterium]|jgi:hypothetical protein|nr:hypothetical protein [Bacteroidales bacterium]
MNNKQLGNPALVAVAKKAATSYAIKKGQEKALATRDNVVSYNQSENGRKFRKGLRTIAIAGVVSFAAYKSFQIIRRNQLKKRAATDPEVKAAVDIWSSIPDAFKKKFKFIDILFLPFAMLGKAYDSVKALWDKTNTQRMMSIAQSISNKNLRPEKISKYFKALYGIDFITLLNRVMSNEQIDMFFSYINGGTGSQTSIVTQGKYAVAIEDVKLRDEPQISDWYGKTNVRKVCTAGSVAGQVTGNERVFNKGKKSTVFIEIMAYDSSKNKSRLSQPVWAWKGAFEYMEKSEIIRKYGSMRYFDTKLTLADKLRRSGI